MRLVAAELADDAQQNRTWLRPLNAELDLALSGIGFDTGQPFEKIVVPGHAAKLAVGDRLESDLLWAPDHRGDFAILDRSKSLGGNPAIGAIGAGFLQRRRPQQTADM